MNKLTFVALVISIVALISGVFGSDVVRFTLRILDPRISKKLKVEGYSRY